MVSVDFAVLESLYCQPSEESIFSQIASEKLSQTTSLFLTPYRVVFISADLVFRAQ